MTYLFSLNPSRKGIFLRLVALGLLVVCHPPDSLTTLHAKAPPLFAVEPVEFRINGTILDDFTLGGTSVGRAENIVPGLRRHLEWMDVLLALVPRPVRLPYSCLSGEAINQLAAFDSFTFY